jgi:hypothetical protein
MGFVTLVGDKEGICGCVDTVGYLEELTQLSLPKKQADGKRWRVLNGLKEIATWLI